MLPMQRLSISRWQANICIIQAIRDLIRKEWPAIKKAIDFCFSTDTDGDHLIENTQQGHGWEEGGDLYVTHTTQYMVACWAEALTQAAYMAHHIGLTDLATRYDNEAKIVLGKLNSEFWNPSTGFFNHGLFKNGTYLTEPSVMTAIPVYWGQITDPVKSKNVMEQIASCNFTTDWGTRIVSEKAKFFAPGGYHTGSVWPLFTGWASLGDYAAGYAVQGFSKMMSNLLVYKNWSLGYIEEVLHGTQYKYFGVCRHQAWSETMVLQPAIEGMLGLKPDAMENRVWLNLAFPADWDSVTVENIRVGSTVFSLTQERKQGKTILNFTPVSDVEWSADHPSFAIFFTVQLLKGDYVEKTILNGEEKFYGHYLENKTDFSGFAILTDTIRLEIFHSGGIGVLPIVHHPAPGDSSTGFKVIRDDLIGDNYVVKVEGLSGTSGRIRVIQAGKVVGKDVVLPESKEKYVRFDLEFRK
jgi:hypothetical protein